MTPAWLTAHTTVLLSDGWPAAYEHLVDHVAETLSGDPAWQAWWAASGVPQCRLLLTLDEAGIGSTVTAGRTRVEVHLATRPEPLESREPASLLVLAAADVTRMLEVARRELSLNPLPTMDLPEPPDDLPRGTQHPAGLPVLVADEQGTGGLLHAVVTSLVSRFRGHRPG